MFWRKVGSNAAAIAQLAFDALPRPIVALEAYRRLRRLLSSSPQRYVAPIRGRRVASRGEWRGRKLTTTVTDLVVEGFPGSGNSFVSNCLRGHLDPGLNVESHFHYTAQLKRALSFGVPAVVLVRAPADAWSSLKSKEPALADWVIGLRWILYYRYVLKHVSELCVFTFDEVVVDVDVLRRCEAVRNRLDGEISADLSFRRESSVRLDVGRHSPVVKLLLGIAETLYHRIQDRRREPRPV